MRNLDDHLVQVFTLCKTRRIQYCSHDHSNNVILIQYERKVPRTLYDAVNEQFDFIGNKCYLFCITFEKHYLAIYLKLEFSSTALFLNLQITFLLPRDLLWHIEMSFGPDPKILLHVHTNNLWICNQFTETATRTLNYTMHENSLRFFNSVKLLIVFRLI